MVSRTITVALALITGWPAIDSVADEDAPEILHQLPMVGDDAAEYLAVRDTALKTLPDSGKWIVRSAVLRFDIDSITLDPESVGQTVRLTVFPDFTCVAKSTEIYHETNGIVRWHGDCVNLADVSATLIISPTKRGVIGRFDGSVGR